MSEICSSPTLGRASNAGSFLQRSRTRSLSWNGSSDQEDSFFFCLFWYKKPLSLLAPSITRKCNEWKLERWKKATKQALKQPWQKEVVKAKRWRWFRDAQTVSTNAPPRRLWSESISPTSFFFVASVLPMSFYFILMSNPWCRNIACSAHKCVWCVSGRPSWICFTCQVQRACWEFP